MIVAARYHDFSAGHRVVGHEGKCRNLHGHNYRVHFEVCAVDSKLDDLGRVIDFSVIKSRLCDWLETYWDHKFLVWDRDPLAIRLQSIDPTVVLCTFNPTAENMGHYLFHDVAPHVLEGTNAMIRRIVVEETRKCSAMITAGGLP